MARTVFCQYEQRETEGLDFVPYPGELGKRIFANVGKPAWAAWLAHQTMLINENRLSPRDPKHRAFLEAELEKFLFGGGVGIERIRLGKEFGGAVQRAVVSHRLKFCKELGKCGGAHIAAAGL